MKKHASVFSVPMIPLREEVIFPNMTFPVFLGREHSIMSAEEGLLRDRMVFLVLQKNDKVDMPERDDLHDIGIIAEMQQLLKLPDGTVKILVEGLSRARLLKYARKEKFYEVEIECIQENAKQGIEDEALMRLIAEEFEKYISKGKKIPQEVLMSVTGIVEAGKFADTIAAYLELDRQRKQEILELVEVGKRLKKIYDYLKKEIEIIDIEEKIREHVKLQMEKTQKEYYLNEQLKAIKKELGVSDGMHSELEEWKEKAKSPGFPDEAREKICKELSRLEFMPSFSAESTVIKTYIECLLELPWTAMTEDKIDIDQAVLILDEDHYGLEKVKERIIEYLSVRKISKVSPSQILCFVGPPGVGKTSLAESIARALNRNFVRVSLGGVRDEAELRGHRRTYVGSLPGRIIQGIKKAKSKNPVFLLDEIDKMSIDFRGDPSAALMEILDPEQNKRFSDHYVELEFDLSEVFFICTANNTFNIPKPLLDRMEMIELHGYTEKEKLKIARKFLIPKQIKQHGLDGKNIVISDNSVMKIIRSYTKEAGVRELTRQIAGVCRKVAKESAREPACAAHAGKEDKKRELKKIGASSVFRLLGLEKYREDRLKGKDEVGVATGLAWTESGGEIMPIEVVVVEGRGNVNITGMIGEVMVESAKAAVTFARTQAKNFRFPKEFYKNRDIHIHVPEGAIPKDGPSAGITMAVALISALSKTPVKKDIALTGEITIKGKVLPVGGLKNKVLAAQRNGIKNVIIPKENAKEVSSLAPEIRSQINFIPVSNVEEVIKRVFKR